MSDKVVNKFITSVVNKPHVFFVADQKVADNALQIAKHFYDSGKPFSIVPKEIVY
jgi:U3 small nucleolar RNA-associated protein MPP10